MLIGGEQLSDVAKCHDSQIQVPAPRPSGPHPRGRNKARMRTCGELGVPSGGQTVPPIFLMK